MPNSPQEHFEYTLQEWKSHQFNEIVKNLPENIDVVYDIGANAGGFTEVMKQLFPNGKFYCFEPIEETFEYLKKKLPYAKCFQVGIYYGATESKAVWRGSNIGSYFVEQIDAGNDVIITDKIMKLREMESFDIDIPDLIKLDIEGAEENIIEFSKMIKQTPYLIIEWHPNKDPYKFFEKHLPNHKILFHIEGKQFLLTLK